MSEEKINISAESLYLDTTTIDEGHVHTYAIDIDGDGETLKTINLDDDNEQHVHKIEHFEVKETNKHIHFLKSKIEVQAIPENEELESQEIECIKEQRIILNTGENGIVQFITEKIKESTSDSLKKSIKLLNVLASSINIFPNNRSTPRRFECSSSFMCCC